MSELKNEREFPQVEKIDHLKKPQSSVTIVAESFKNICSNTTAHAIPNIARSEIKIVTILWVFLLLGGTGATIYYVYDALTNFFSYPSSVNIDFMQLQLEDFPAVTFCNLNPFDSSSVSVKKYLEQSLEKNGLSSVIKGDESKSAIYQVNTAMKVLRANSMFDSKFNKSLIPKELNFNLESMMISCSFNGQTCTKDDFDNYRTFEYGNCFTFNVKNQKNGNSTVRQTSQTGAGSGLTLELFTGYPGIQDDYMDRRGIYLSVHNNSNKASTKFDGIKLPVGYSSEIGIKRNFYTRIGPPYSECRKNTSYFSEDDPTYYKNTLGVGIYSRKVCFEICLQNEFIIPKCNCSDPSVPITNDDQKLCSTLNETICVEDVRKFFDSKDLTKFCEDQCPRECDKVEYLYDINNSDYPSVYYYNVIKDQPNLKGKFEASGNLSYNLFKQSVLMVNVHYQELSYTFYEEIITYKVSDIIGSVGGQVGLFLGCSVLTFFEPLEFLLEVLFKIVNRSNRKSGTVVKPFNLE
ncbi:unnamed protein product [Brachionus calyciflorus]|uniref:Acid-sensing ion channel 1 n=1 Tax=Brachionus calyciflorus TaxID=104777 RepID=A0A813NBH5_9BILA|nr:unnamed protein product [Brachionus calyciflorus]